MPAVFMDSQGVYTDYLEKGHRALLCRIIWRFRCQIVKKGPIWTKKNEFFHYDNASARTSAVATAKLVEIGYELFTVFSWFDSN